MDRSKQAGASVEQVEDNRFKGSSTPVLFWIYETKSAGKNGVLVFEQTAFKAWKEAQRLLGVELNKLTIVMGTKISVPCRFEMPLVGEIVTVKERKPRRKKKKPTKPKSRR